MKPLAIPSFRSKQITFSEVSLYWAWDCVSARCVSSMSPHPRLSMHDKSIIHCTLLFAGLSNQQSSRATPNMSIQRWTDSDDDFFANPFRALLNPRYFGPSLLTAPNTSLNAPSPIKVDVVEVTLQLIIVISMTQALQKNLIYADMHSQRKSVEHPSLLHRNFETLDYCVTLWRTERNKAGLQ